MTVATVPFPTIAARVQRLWRPDRAPHHVIFAKTRAGKTHLITRGLLPMCEQERVLILDVKGDDKVWHGYGRRVDKLPADFSRDGNGQPRSKWYRLVVDPQDSTAKGYVKRVLEQIEAEGHCILVIDESRTLCDNRYLGLMAEVEALLMRAGSRNVSVIIAAQSVGYAPVSLKDQGSFYWIGHSGDIDRQKRLLAVIGQPASFLPALQDLAPRQWLYSDHESGRATTATFTL